MRVCLVTWRDPEKLLTGVAAYVRDLATALAGAGHEVAHVYGEPRAWQLVRRASLRWTVRRGERRTAVFTNSPAGGTLEARLQADVASVDLAAALAEALERIRPDIVHLHDLSGLPAGFISEARARGYPVIVTLHDFWAFCRQLLLVRPGLVPCDGSQGGWNCARYCSDEPPARRRLLARLLASPAPLSWPVHGAVRLFRRLRRGHSSQFVIPIPARGGMVPDEQTLHAYASREALMRQALLDANCLLTPSEYARMMYVRHGYPADRIRVLPLSLLFEGAPRGPRRFRGYPVRFGYLGRVTAWKGAHLLAEAARGIAPSQARFTFYGAVEAEDRRFLTTTARGADTLSFRGRYTRAQLPRIMDEIDVAVFPSIMRETQGLVGLEARIAGVPVIAAAAGAIPEYVRHEVDGLLFTPGSADSLRVQIQRVLDAPESIGRLSGNIRAPRPMEDHVTELLSVYEAAAGKEPAGQVSLAATSA